MGLVWNIKRQGEYLDLNAYASLSRAEFKRRLLFTYLDVFSAETGQDFVDPAYGVSDIHSGRMILEGEGEYDFVFTVSEVVDNGIDAVIRALKDDKIIA